MHLQNLKSILLQIASAPFILLIKCYQYCISPLKPPSCRFTPTCSEYSIQAIKKHGPFIGLYLAVKRILRCNPWGGSGYDPVP
ncbi:MAG TPA: membrane protein insertion efficiency factor YidD [Rikenellaceae bacterium]|nr:membrane protein insertion efficiency factor YidD [Rikenellaceae bacterium]